MKKSLVLMVTLCVSACFITTAHALTQKQLEQRLRQNALLHIDTMCQQMPDCGGKIQTIKKPNGKWIRTYCELKKDSLKIKVHEVQDTGKFVGTIKYIKVTYEAVGNSKESVMQQPFRVVEKNRVTKIRQYKDNKWQ
ncbi:MAG: hypothetical protein MI749_08155 [Desulfovibrionales bacterium]|nr:hypothetical protein [Desulfovibrionales bacterium]